MKENANAAIKLILKHEGGFVNHPNDPGGATNMGVTIGTMRSLGMDLDGDGDVDVRDVKALTVGDAMKVYKRFYWDKVEGDLLPSGVDYTVADFAVNSGPSRSAKHLQKVVGVVQDGDIGPKTLAAVADMAPEKIIKEMHQSRLRFLQNLKTWKTFGRGWKRRVDEVRDVSLAWAEADNWRPAPPQRPAQAQPAPKPTPTPSGGFMAFLRAILSMFGGRK